jgi:hypothetical protein
MLVDASSVPATDLDLVDGAAINLASIGTSKISIRYAHAIVSSELPASVLFNVSGTGAGFTHLEGAAPYTLLGDRKHGRKYIAWSPDAGVYELTVTAFAGTAGNGEVLNKIVTTLTIQDTLSDLPFENQIASLDDQPHGNSDASNSKFNILLLAFLTLPMVATIAIVMVRRRRNQRSYVPEMEWDTSENIANHVAKCQQDDPAGFVASVDHTDFANPARNPDGEWEWNDIA